MWIRIGNTHAEVARGTDEEKAWLREYLSFPITSWVGGRPHQENVRMFSLVRNDFPAGFLALVTKAAGERGYSVEILDTRTPPAARDSNADLTWLRDYQLGAVEASIAKTRGILWMPTGAGKTEVAAGLVKAIPTHWVFLVHRSTLLDQAAERYERRTGQVAMRIGDGLWQDTGKPAGGSSLTVATFQTLAQNMKSLDAQRLFTETRGVMIDECHVLPADSFWKVAMAFQNAYYRIGLSGTPLARGDRRSILAIAALGNVVYRIKTEVLVEAGVLSRPKIRLTPVYQESDCPTWQGVYGECIVRSAKRNSALASAAMKADKPCLIFVKEIKHGKLLMKRLEKDGVKADFVWGTDSTDRRKDAVKRLVRGDTEVLICSVIFQEGVDIPELRSVVIGSGGKSVIAALQRIGRGMRRSEGKDTFEVWDIADKGNKWLEKHTQARLHAYTSEGHETVVVSSLGTELKLGPVKAVGS
jgi:superfamily II DNA or RNA helicase